MAPSLTDTGETQSDWAASTPTKVGINGFGRIGRSVLRASLLRDDLSVVAINHTCASIDDVIHEIRYDSTHGPVARLTGIGRLDVFPINDHTLSLGGRRVHLFSTKDITQIPWAEVGVEFVVESTGKFTSSLLAKAHIESGGARKVLISAPSKDSPTLVYGVNSQDYLINRPDVISCASCTTNCLAPIAKVLDGNFGVAQALMTTVHASTRSQHVLDGYSKRDRRAGRSVLGNVIPTSTGAAKAVSKVLPQLDGKLTGLSLRVPICNVSLVDLTVNLEKSTSLAEIFEKFEEASLGAMKGVVQVEADELVSCDFQGNSHSAVIDAKVCVELNSKFFKILAWYDNEWAYSVRLLDMLAYMAKVEYIRPEI
ncbi:glyceraldehyde-3-phosphate dehydrogenase [Hyaloscypha variabilis]